jgi:hypothetical protein
MLNKTLNQNSSGDCLLLDTQWPIDKLLDSLIDEIHNLIEEPRGDQIKKEVQTDDIIINSIFN